MIPGGYILKARKTLESDLMDKPPLWSKLWDWMLLRAEWRSDSRLQRGQFWTTIEDMREAMSWYVGYRKVMPTVKELRRAYEGLREGTMIGTTKGTRGMLVTVLNYNEYQNPKNYEGLSEGHNEKSAKGESRAQDRKEFRTKGRINTGTPDGEPGHVEADEGKPEPAPKVKPKVEPKDPRPSGCPPEAWGRYLKISRGYHKSRADQLGRQAPFTEAKVVDGARALDNLIRVKGSPETEVLAVLGWASEDVFWSSNLRSIGALLKKSSNNNELKYGNVLAAMTRDLERKRAQEAANG